MIVAIVDDLIFRSKLSATAKAKHASVQFLSGSVDLEKIKLLQPSKIILDLNAMKLEPLKLAQKIKSSSDTLAIPTIAFLSHIQADLYAAAKAAGCDIIMPRSEFVKELENLL